jgi:putative inorganic carbon (HCO3(-)) transporter
MSQAKITTQPAVERICAWFSDAALVAALFTAPLLWGRFQDSGLAVAFGLVAAGWVAFLVAALFARRELRFVSTPLNLPLALLLVLALASSIFVSVNRYHSFRELYKLLACAGLFWLIANQPASLWRRRLYLIVLVLAGVVVSWLGAREYVLERIIGRNPSWRIFATFFNPNELAGYLELVGALAIAAFLWSRWAALRILAGFAALLTILALLLTGSRGGWLGLAVGLFVFALLAGAALRRTRLALVSGIVVIVLIAAVSLAFAPLRTRLLGGAGEHSSNAFRELTWRGTAAIIGAHPVLGIGPGAFQFIYPRYAVGGFTRMAHENYLQVAAETGIPGGIAFVWMLGAFFWVAGTGFRRLRERESRLLCAACIAGVIAFCVHSLVDYGWYIGAIALTVCGLFGLAANAMAAPPPQPQAPPPARKRRRAEQAVTPTPDPEPALLPTRRYPLRLSPAGRWSAVIVAATIACLLASQPARAALAQCAFQRGRAAESQGDLAAAAQYYRQALRLAPASGEYHRYVGRMMGAPRGIEQVEIAAKLEPTNAINHLLLARMYEIAGPWDQAAAEYQRAIDLYPNFLAAYRGLADLEARRRRIQIALGLYRRMIEIERSPYERYKALEQGVETEYAYAHYALGRAALESGDLPRARAELDRALAILQSGETVGAGMRAALREAGEITPRSQQALAELNARILWRQADLAAREGDAATADSLRAQARQLDPLVERLIEQEPPLSEKPSAAPKSAQQAAAPAANPNRPRMTHHGPGTTDHGPRR